MIVRGAALRNEDQKSCGCLKDEKFRQRVTKHGLSKHPLYRVWGTMIQRCINPATISYPRYGGRGISVCQEWRDSFPAFLRDVGERPPNPEGWTSRKPYWSLDRIDPDGDYEPGNVRWASWKDQGANKGS